MSLPDGVVTFLFTDVEGSTRLWEEAPSLMMDALRIHDEKIDEAVAEHNGLSVKPRGEGDSRFVVFRGADDAVAAAAQIQRLLDSVEWATPRPIRVRASLHTGMAELEMGDYYGSAVNRAARLRAIAHGGQTVLSGSTYELVQDRLPDGVTLIDLGQHRLKDLTRLERVYQLDVEGLDRTFPPLQSLDAVPNNIPEQLTELIGRETELVEISHLLESVRLLTILAPGGTGKTRLALQAAADHVADYPNGAFFVQLADIASSGEIVQSIADELGLALASGDAPLDQLAAYLKSRRVLLLLDNFEHVIEGAGTVSRLLDEASDVSVIVTSRTKLNLQGETVFTLGGLRTNRDGQTLQTEAALLFSEAARRAKADFALHEEDVESLAKILDLTGGLPLAIVLAAAWVQVLSVSQIAEELAMSLEILQTSMSDVPERQQSMRAVFEYTWRQLAQREQEVFSAMSVFRGGFTREAASSVAGASLIDLANLSGKSLLTRDEQSGRYAIHELIRQYAEAELAADPDRHERVLEAQASFFAGIVDEAFSFLSKADHPRMLDIVEGDIENVRLAWRRSLDSHESELLRRIAIPLFFLYEVRGWYQSGAALFEEAIERFSNDATEATDPVVGSLLRLFHLWFASLLGMPDPDAGFAAVGELRPLGDDAASWIGLQCLALSLAYSGGDWSEVADEGLAVGTRMDGPFWHAAMKNWRAGAASNTGQLDLGARLLSEGRAVLEQLDEHWYLGANFGHHGTIAVRQGHYEQAKDFFEHSVERSGAIGHLRSLQLSLTGLGEVRFELADFAGAEGAFLDGLDVAERMGLTREILQMLIHLARVRAAAGRPAEAVELLSAVVADPMSSTQTVWESQSLAEIASGELARLEPLLDPPEFSSRRAAGTAVPYQVVVKQLLDRA